MPNRTEPEICVPISLAQADLVVQRVVGGQGPGTSLLRVLLALGGDDRVMMADLLAEGDSIPLGGVDVSLVIYLYPGSAISDGHGSDTPLADAEEHRGFRDLHDDLVACRFATVGVSSQPVEKQQEAIAVNRLEHQLASDESLWSAGLLTLSTFRLGGERFYQRLTLVVAHGVILHVFYPVTVPGRNAAEVAAQLRSR